MLCWQRSWGVNIIDKRGLNITHSTVKVKAPLTQFRADNMQEQWAKPQSLFHFMTIAQVKELNSCPSCKRGGQLKIRTKSLIKTSHYQGFQSRSSIFGYLCFSTTFRPLICPKSMMGCAIELKVFRWNNAVKFSRIYDPALWIVFT